MPLWVLEFFKITPRTVGSGSNNFSIMEETGDKNKMDGDSGNLDRSGNSLGGAYGAGHILR